MTQGAIQISVLINEKTIHIDRKNLVSLKINRILGDAADEFTLEIFDESAWKVEAALKGTASKSSDDTSKLAPITVMYSASTDLNRTKTVLFSGIILNYQVAFTRKVFNDYFKWNISSLRR